MTLIVFSYNRALQLSAFLISLFKHFKADDYKVVVIYNSGGGDYEKAYEQLKERFPQVSFVRRKKIDKTPLSYLFRYKKNLYRYFKHDNLRKKLTDFKEVLETAVANSPHEAIAFFTDDSIFFQDVYVDNEILQEVAKDKSAKTVYSLRHGLNLAIKPEQIFTYKKNYAWNVVPSSPEMIHWTYMFSIDGHIYPKSFLLPIFKKLNYVNPNSFEGFVNDYTTNECKNIFNKLIFPAQNVLVGFELNQVQNFSNNNHHNFSIELLNKKFLEGYQLRYLYDEKAVTDFRPPLKGVEFYKADNPAVKEEILINQS